MRPLVSWLIPAILFLASSLPASAQSGDLGRIDFPTSGSAEAQKHFLRGALLLHSFEFEDAAEEFRAAQKIEPGFAMAYWGEAETKNHPLWMERDRNAALEALKRLGPTPEARRAKAPTEREKGYLDAAEALYGEGEKADRDLAYAESMRRLHEKYPDDLDAASFYALSLLGTTEGKRDIPTYMKAAGIAEEVFAKNPLHPGAVHYLIHCYDDPVHAPLGMRVARVYAKIAPAAGHALHMPSHIFFASGMWEEAAASNAAAWKASLERAQRKSLGPDDHNYHALLWLEYANLELGRYADARRALALIEKDAAEAKSTRARSHLAMMRAAYLVETRQWDGEAARLTVATEDLPQKGLALFVEGARALERGDRAAAEKALADLQAAAKAKAEAPHSSTGMSYMMHRSSGADSVMARELEAKILFARGETDRALALAREAASSEDALSFEFGPPVVVKPAHELLAEMLLDAKRAADARKEFETTLSKTPGRALALLGLARSASQSGDATAARQAYAELVRIWSRADPDLPERREIAATGAVAATGR
jgi:tetratricopeptide (TPR) repeat protein